MRLSEKSKGFSLMEVLIAIVILAIALLALAGLMVQTTRNNSFGNKMTEASSFAQDMLERISARPFNSMLSGADVVTGSTGQDYNRSWNVIKTITTMGNYAEVYITINWDDPIRHSINFVHGIRDNID